jgi:hypothetical protein
MSKTNNKIEIFLNLDDINNPVLEVTENKKVTKINVRDKQDNYKEDN